ncbi:hypothetical protein ASPWEDRAFT_35843 [Aspergillus wentii DTO 134E9]|uniref:sn-1-specific diacylglycerol lipase n=1 Tax=Aspergillus wentii DTO 134E9 TaxID=1073089 RepID=A0A1L9RTH6_ASPWE|nr:uncharacterized protein ASPWEDRAFT_35843 [Aspergillus wentii DTO 134E9]OJJ38225.1 hypothetical protein ASPWEDRAFT_35843 [Aspergillus wentii DTO 134E9]
MPISILKRRTEVKPETNEDLNRDDGTSHVPATSGAPLLPRPVASFVSLLTQSTSLSLRLGSFFGGAALDGARVTTLTGLELSRAVIEGILTRAGRDVAFRSSGDHGKAEAESLLERSIAALHTTVTSASFIAAATFHFSSTTLSSASNLTQTLLSTLDAILGSTESSRAIAAIITLIRREFRRPELDIGAEKIGVGDLLVGTVGFALLQRWGKKNTEREIHENGGDEIIWDVVILDNGSRADVIRTHPLKLTNNPHTDLNESKRSSFMSPGNEEGYFNAVQRRPSMVDAIDGPRLSLPSEDQHQMDEDIRLHIMKQLPRGCHASIRTDLLTARTITVDVFDDDTAEIAAPPGTMMIEEKFHQDRSNCRDELADHRHLPKHTVVFRTEFNKSQSANVRHQERGTPESTVEDLTGAPTSLRMIGTGDEETTRNNRSNEQRTGIRNSQSSSHPSLGASETNVKTTTGKSSLSKFTQKVKPSGKPSITPQGQSNKASKGSTADKSLVPRRLPSKPGSEGRTNKTVSPSSSQVSFFSSPVANRGLPRSPLQDSSRMKSTASSAARHGNTRDTGTDYFSVREKNQESYMAHTDAYSRRTGDIHPGSPAATRNHVRSSSSLSLTRSEADMTVSVNNDSRPGSSSFHRRKDSFSPSIYSLATAGSETSLILAHRARKSAYEDAATIQALNRDGLVPGIFPEMHFVKNIRRFCRFSLASYGSNALKVMGVPKTPNSLPSQETHSQEHSDFSNHAGLPASTILLSSFVDPAGGTNAAGETETGFPLVHYLCLDHESKAIVLTLRGTWGFEDILTDMTCDYDDLEWQGKSWKVHKGMHASAKRLLEGGGGRVMITIRAALEEYPDYGVVLCGHSLGGGVAALLATMISEPSNESSGTSFVTASYQSVTRRLLLAQSSEHDTHTEYFLPPGRPIHVYAYGPPAVMSPFLRRATRGLITTVVNGQDVVPSLSLGILHDMHMVSLAFKNDISEARSNVRGRVWEGIRHSIVNKFYVNEPPMLVQAGDGVGEDAWAWKTLKGLRADLLAPKLMPPGEVFVVETMRVLKRDAFTSGLREDGYPLLGRPATRVQLKFIRDVEAMFGELRFGSGMLSDHNPARYETSLAALARGILDE